MMGSQQTTPTPPSRASLLYTVVWLLMGVVAAGYIVTIVSSRGLADVRRPAPVDMIAAREAAVRRDMDARIGNLQAEIAALRAENAALEAKADALARSLTAVRAAQDAEAEKAYPDARLPAVNGQGDGRGTGQTGALGTQGSNGTRAPQQAAGTAGDAPQETAGRTPSPSEPDAAWNPNGSAAAGPSAPAPRRAPAPPSRKTGSAASTSVPKTRRQQTSAIGRAAPGVAVGQQDAVVNPVGEMIASTGGWLEIPEDVVATPDERQPAASRSSTQVRTVARRQLGVTAGGSDAATATLAPSSTPVIGGFQVVSAAEDAGNQAPSRGRAGYGVLVARGTSYESVQFSWNLMRNRHRRLLGPLSPSYPTDVANRLTPFQLVVGPLRTARDAEALCAKLAVEGETCEVTRFGG